MRRRSPAPAPPATTTDEAPAAGGAAVKVRLFTTATPANLDATLLAAIVLLLVAFGLVMVLSSSSVEEFAAGKGFSSRFIRQAVFAALGVPLMLLIARIPARVLLGRASWLALGGAVVLQTLVFTPLGVEIQGNRAWLDLGVTTVQPAEFAKVALCLALGYLVALKGERIRDWRHVVLPIGLPVGIVIGLALLGEDLGTVMVLGALVLGAMWFGGLPKRYLFVVVVLAVAGALLLALTSPNRLARITSFLSADCDYEGLCWQTVHGYYALAHGGLFGVGLGNSTAKWSWLPEADNDFIFAIVGEEFGFVGALVVILMFVALAVVLLRIWRATDDPAGRVAIGGVLSWIMFQSLVNIGVVLGLLPVLGVPLPFVSSGGSALVTTLAAMGVVLAIARRNAEREHSAAQPPAEPRGAARPTTTDRSRKASRA